MFIVFPRSLIAAAFPKPTVLVVGGGAAGILAAYRAASLGASVTLIEKNERIGMKILISGGGRCNVTHAGEMEAVRQAFRPNEARFLKPSFYRFTNQDILDLLQRRGLRFYTRPDGRVFPVESTASEVVEALRECLVEVGVRIRVGVPVVRIDVATVKADETAPGWENAAPALRVQGVQMADSYHPTRSVVLCVGGSSYPGTGTTGDGWPWLEAAGHTVVKVRAALAPLFLEKPVVEWAGVAIRDCLLRARQGGKSFAAWRGDLLFTHRGLSGPCALGISREVAERRPNGPVGVEVDLLPDRPPDEAQVDFARWLRENPRRLASAYVEPILPARLVSPFLESCGCSSETRSAHLPQSVRNAMVQSLKGWPLGSVQHVPLEKGEVVAGGAALDEVDPQTMRSRKAAGLYLCGEILDIAGPVGGYNLQAAWSTGFVAGETAARDAAR